MNLELRLKNILQEILNHDTQNFTAITPLLGEYPELDSMGIMTLIIAIEGNFKIDINDIELSAETFATFGSLIQTIESITPSIESAA